MKSADDLRNRLRELHAQTSATPLFNPVFQLSHELSRALESGRMSLSDFQDLVEVLECDALMRRASKLRGLVVSPAMAREGARQHESLAAFKERWERPHLHAVFTAHPTFLLTPSQSEAIGRAAANQNEIGAVCAAPAQHSSVTLQYEHDRAMEALSCAQNARDRIVTGLLEEAASRWPDEWHDFLPLPFRFATWVGYDMDGRTDIAWHRSIAFRLLEQALRLDRYGDALESIDDGHPLLVRLRSAAEFARLRSDEFQHCSGNPETLAAIADRLTEDHRDKLTSLKDLIAQLEEEARICPTGRAIRLKTLSSAMRADGLGMGWVHFRVNASQLHNAIRQRMDQGEGTDFASKRSVAAIRELLDTVRPLRANFAALAVESSSAIRQFLAMQQILRHIDSDTPIRLLIAECEVPSTVLAALYFARLFGIADRVDISPLFETETALEQGGRVVEALVSERAYREYVRGRGRLCIQTGFSDAGRFIGQVPASLAIERLQGRLADTMHANGLTQVAALIFNTHGESMGRGAHPGSFADRLSWPLSSWARQRFARSGIRIEPEVSFQGGDGYLFFANREIAFATLSRIIGSSPAAAEDDSDDFYRRTDLSLDLYRAIKEHQHDYLESRTYVQAVTAFGLGLLAETGSRKTRRQSELATDRDMSLRQIRAIPHNAILQQLGYPVNVIAGVGSAAAGNLEEVAALLGRSERGRQMLRLVRSANALASIKTVAAYGELFNSAYWASRTYRGVEHRLSASCQALAEYLLQDDRASTFRRLASRLRIDALKLHRLLEQVPDESPLEDREQVRRSVGVLHALRLALFQHMFLKVIAIPVFARANDISREDVVEMILTLRVEEALEQLRRAFPTDFPTIEDFALQEESEYPDRVGLPYQAIRRDYIDAIENAYALSHRIGAAIANFWGAHG